MNQVAQIREMADADAPAVSRILVECYHLLAEPDGLTEPQLQALIADRASPEHVLELAARFTCFVAELQGVVAGFLAVEPGSINELFVLPEFHRRGVGAALFRHAARRLRERGYEYLSLTTTGYGRPFYEAMGMHVTGRCPVTCGPLIGRELLVLEGAT